MRLTICLSCGKETKNPKFCDRSCAAKFNNQKNPKRKPEHKCRGCGQPITANKQLCETCTQKARTVAERKAQNIRTWTGLSSEPMERPIAPAYVSAEMVFNTSFGFGGRDQLDSVDKIDALLDRLTAICFAQPEYLRKLHAARHIVLLNEFRNYRYETGWRETREEVRAGDRPIDELSSALYSWVSHVLNSDGHPLMPSYVLDTTTFIQDHVQESYRYRDDRWKIIPLVKPGKRGDRVRFIDSSFKREFTQKTGNIICLCKVPEGGRIVESTGNVLLEAGNAFLSTASRCHLSTGVSDHVLFACKEDNGPKYDLHDDFAFYGSLFTHRVQSGIKILNPAYVLNAPNTDEVRESLSEIFSHFTFYPSGFETPAHWIEATVEMPSRFGSPSDSHIVVNPVPVWRVEFDS